VCRGQIEYHPRKAPIKPLKSETVQSVSVATQDLAQKLHDMAAECRILIQCAVHHAFGKKQAFSPRLDLGRIHGAGQPAKKRDLVKGICGPQKQKYQFLANLIGDPDTHEASQDHLQPIGRIADHK
jgi:hypothetical protein